MFPAAAAGLHRAETLEKFCLFTRLCLSGHFVADNLNKTIEPLVAAGLSATLTRPKKRLQNQALATATLMFNTDSSFMFP